MSKKSRPKIPRNIEVALLYESDRTCCICQDSSRKVQIHHIDGTPANNDPDNLVVMCFDDHDEVSKSGGLAKGISPALLKKYRDEWYATVRKRREMHFHPDKSVSSLPENADLHRLMMDAIAAHELRRLFVEVRKSDWNQTGNLLSQMDVYTDERYGFHTRMELLDSLYSLACRTRRDMPVAVASQVKELTVSVLPILSLVAPAIRPATDQDVDLLTTARCVGHSLTYDGIKHLKSLGVVSAGVDILWHILRYARLNESLGETEDRTLQEFDSLEQTASQFSLSDALVWIRFQREDALAIKGDDLPEMPMDVAHRVSAAEE